MRRAVFCAIVALSAAFSDLAAQELDAGATVSVRGYRLQLKTQEGRCVVAYNRGERQGALKLELPPPCHFVYNEKGTVQSYFYKDIGNATVLLVVGGPIDKRRTDKLMQEGCGTQAQAILLRRRDVSTTKEIARGGVFCPSGGVERKLFSVLAHSK
jgi:hypothetical protein